MLANNITELIGKTPLLRLNRMTANLDVEIFLKLESMNPLGSVKDRLALALITDAEKKGRLGPDNLIVEPSSGNTGIALAFICAQRGYLLALTMPESTNLERRRIFLALGAKLHLTPAQYGMNGAIRKAEEITAQTPGALMLRQFENFANPRYHEETTGPEIWADSQEKVDVFVAGVGTGGTFTGVSRFLKKKNPSLYAVAVEPDMSAVLSGKLPGPHKIQGLGAGFIPEVMDTTLVDEVLTVSAKEARDTTHQLARNEGVFVGISSGANVAAARTLARRPGFAKKRIVTLGYDTGDRYLTTWLYQE